MKSWKTLGKDELSLTETDIEDLVEFAEYEDLAGVEALNLLQLNNAIEIDEPVFFPEENKSIDRTKPKEGTVEDLEEKGLLSLYPNPAKNFFTLDFDIKALHEKVILRIVDSRGVVIYTTVLKNAQDQIIVDTSNKEQYGAGLYQCEILLDGKPYLSESIVIQ